MKIQIRRRSADPISGLTPHFAGWLAERYGDHAAQISVDITLKIRSAVKDVARALRADPEGRPGQVPARIEQLCARFTMPPQGVTDEHFVLGHDDEDTQVHHPGSCEPGHTNSDPWLIQYIEEFPEDWKLVRECLGMPRQKGRHACGWVIADRPIEEFIPKTTVGGVRVTAFTPAAVEAVGGIKMDFLRVNSIKDIQDAIRLLHTRYAGGPLPDTQIDGMLVPGHHLVPIPGGGYADVWDLPEDLDVFRDVSEGRTTTVFQFDTPGVLKWLVHFNHPRPDGRPAICSIRDMAAFTALDRPGGLDASVRNPDWAGADDAPQARHNMLVEFARRTRGLVGSQDVLPVLRELVPETYGVMVFQEQMQYVYQQVTGSTGAEAEEFRRLVAKKKFEKIEGKRTAFVERAAARFGLEAAESLWDGLKAWAKYGFNASHAVCYAIIAYACAYLKHHYPLEWWCSVLSNAEKDEINTKFWPACGHLTLLPDVQHSKATWVIEGNRLRAPINLLHGVGPMAHAQLCRYAPYTSLEDFADKIRQHREAGRHFAERKKKQKKGYEGPVEYETVSVPGRSALHRGIVYKLIVSGAMDSLLPEGCSVGWAMDLYDQAMTAVPGKDYGVAHAKSKKPAKASLDGLGRYQIRKGILPAYGSDLRALLPEVLPAYLRRESPTRLRYLGTRWDRRTRTEDTIELPVIGGERLAALATGPVPEGGYMAGVIAYVEEVELFTYNENQHLRLTLEVGGGKYHLVLWSDKKGRLPDEAYKVGAGCIVAASLNRYRTEKPFSVREIHVLREALKEEEEDGKEGTAE